MVDKEMLRVTLEVAPKTAEDKERDEKEREYAVTCSRKRGEAERVPASESEPLIARKAERVSAEAALMLMLLIWR